MKATRKIMAMVLSLVFALAMFAPAVSASSPTVRITFNPNGGNGATAWSTRTPGMAHGTLPDGPPRSSHTFLGWYPKISGALGTTSNKQVMPDDLVPNQDITYYARWEKHESKVLTHSNSMVITGLKGYTGSSNTITFYDSSIPAAAKVDSISIFTGPASVANGPTGYIAGNYLQISSTARTGNLQFPWDGTVNTTLANTPFFQGQLAKATYTVFWNGTVTSNSPATLLNLAGTAAIRAFGNVKLTVNYTYTLV